MSTSQTPSVTCTVRMRTPGRMMVWRIACVTSRVVIVLTGRLPSGRPGGAGSGRAAWRARRRGGGPGLPGAVFVPPYPPQAARGQQDAEIGGQALVAGAVAVVPGAGEGHRG